MANSANVSAYDWSIFGGVDPQGNILQLWGGDCIQNSLLMWMSSFQGEIIRNPLKGGYLTTLLTKPMTQVRADDIRTEIVRGLLEDFSPPLSNVTVIVNPDYANRKWNITIAGWSETVKASVQVSSSIKNLA